MAEATLKSEQFIRLFLHLPRQGKKTVAGLLWAMLQPFVVFASFFVLSYAVMNAQAYAVQATSFFKYDILAEYQPKTEVKAASPAVIQTAAAKSVSAADNNQLIIPRLNLTVPVLWNVGPDEPSVLDALHRGVVHLKTTALPGQPGNVFIVGHSSVYWWDRGHQYPTVFADLARLQAGDVLILHYDQKEYRYSVREQKVVEPTDVSVVTPTITPVLSLMTCTPTGTNWRRLVVIADQVEPSPSKTTLASPPPAAVQHLPASR